MTILPLCVRSLSPDALTLFLCCCACLSLDSVCCPRSNSLVSLLLPPALSIYPSLQLTTITPPQPRYCCSLLSIYSCSSSSIYITFLLTPPFVSSPTHSPTHTNDRPTRTPSILCAASSSPVHPSPPFVLPRYRSKRVQSTTLLFLLSSLSVVDNH